MSYVITALISLIVGFLLSKALFRKVQYGVTIERAKQHQKQLETEKQKITNLQKIAEEVKNEKSDITTDDLFTQLKLYSRN
jgi:hypothetical protein